MQAIRLCLHATILKHLGTPRKMSAVLNFAVMSQKDGIFCIGLNRESAQVHFLFHTLIIVECTRCNIQAQQSSFVTIQAT